jgi:methylated-DNA-[protein]-cysteine S-methyltransferase
MTRYRHIATPLGALFAIAVGDKLTGLHYEGGRHAPQVSPAWVEDRGAGPLAECARQLAEYFAGQRRVFELPMVPGGTPFQVRVWHEIARIPYGATLSYAELARRAGAPGVACAAGAATGRNPLSIVVPCHRVIASGGCLTGYAGGLERKMRLLQIEGALRAALEPRMNTDEHGWLVDVETAGVM